MTRTFREEFRARLQSVVVGMGPTEIAQLCGIDPSQVTRILSTRNPRAPNIETLVKLARGLGVSADGLLGLAPLAPRSWPAEVPEETGVRSKYRKRSAKKTA